MGIQWPVDTFGFHVPFYTQKPLFVVRVFFFCSVVVVVGRDFWYCAVGRRIYWGKCTWLALNHESAGESHLSNGGGCGCCCYDDDKGRRAHRVSYVPTWCSRASHSAQQPVQAQPESTTTVQETMKWFLWMCLCSEWDLAQVKNWTVESGPVLWLNLIPRLVPLTALDALESKSGI